MDMLEQVSSHDQFLSEMKDHKMKVVLDTEKHKHLSFSSGGFEHGFEIISFPYHVMITGDMGTYTFSRTDDMLRWFVKDGGKAIARPEKELQRWRQKLVSVDSQLGVVKNSLTQTVKMIEQCEENFIECHPDQKGAIKEVFSDLLRSGEDGVGMLLHELLTFEITIDGEEHAPFSDFEDEDVGVYVLQFAWCCYALNFGIGMYLQEQSQVSE